MSKTNKERAKSAVPPPDMKHLGKKPKLLIGNLFGKQTKVKDGNINSAKASYVKKTSYQPKTDEQNKCDDEKLVSLKKHKEAAKKVAIEDEETIKRLKSAIAKAKSNLNKEVIKSKLSKQAKGKSNLKNEILKGKLPKVKEKITSIDGILSHEVIPLVAKKKVTQLSKISQESNKNLFDEKKLGQSLLTNGRIILTDETIAGKRNQETKKLVEEIFNSVIDRELEYIYINEKKPKVECFLTPESSLQSFSSQSSSEFQNQVLFDFSPTEDDEKDFDKYARFWLELNSRKDLAYLLQSPNASYENIENPKKQPEAKHENNEKELSQVQKKFSALSVIDKICRSDNIRMVTLNLECDAFAKIPRYPSSIPNESFKKICADMDEFDQKIHETVTYPMYANEVELQHIPRPEQKDLYLCAEYGKSHK